MTALSTLHEPARDIPILTRVDTLVAGGGLAGVAAAVAAARRGADTLLVERSSLLGGIATAGLMASITNFYYTGTSELVVGGIATEVVQRLAERGGTTLDWRTRSCPHFTNDPEIFKVLLLDMVRESGAKLLLDAWVVDTLVEDGRVRGAIVQTVAGRRAILAQVTLDAGGNADLAAWAGAPMRGDAAGNSSLEFKMGNVDLEALFQYFVDNPSEYPSNQDIPTTIEDLTYHWRKRGLLFVPHGAGRHMRLVQDVIARGEYQRTLGVSDGMDAFGMYGIRADGTAVINSNFQHVDQLEPWQHSQAIVDARRAVPVAAEFLKKHVPGFKNAFVVTTASEIGVRGTRWVVGDATITDADVLAGRRFPDAVGMAPFRHHKGERLIFLPFATDIPYGVMLPQGLEGLLVCSGKATSSTPRGVLRAQARTMQLGEAAGTASALAIQASVTPRALDVRALQTELLARGGYLGDAALLRQRGLA